MQQTLVEASARDFDCLDYWCRNLSVPSISTDWYTLLTHRYDNMLAQMRREPRADDFRMEKNKCDMYEWFRRNGFRHMKVRYKWSAIGEWGLAPSAPQQVAADLLANRTGPFPVFMKVCHITQGWAHSTRLLKSYASVAASRKELDEWVRNMWEAHANDWERPWATAHNALTDTLAPGVMLQELYAGHFVPNKDATVSGSVVEMKVYVIWGHAYMGSVHDVLLFRDGTMELYSDASWQTMLHGHTSSPYLQWLMSEGHFDRAILMAETAALVAGMDMIRLDFFCRKGDPDGIAFNENSISSARSPVYHHHFDNMAYLWAKGHVERWYRAYAARGMRTYEFSLKAQRTPNQQRLRQKLSAQANLAGKVGLSMDTAEGSGMP